MADLVRLSLSLPQPLLERLEGLMREQGYTNRSEFVRDMIRDHLVVHEWQSAQQEALGTVTLVYNHHIRQLSENSLSCNINIITPSWLPHTCISTTIYVPESSLFVLLPLKFSRSPITC